MKILEIISIVISLIALIMGFIAKVFMNALLIRTPPKTYLFVAMLFLGYAIYARLAQK
ncbi:MAG: hypothetical protein GWP03_07145 [Proteobacteria bacterium]|nr:hypothetical protein [Pseudomonadota bacterium]